MHVALLPCEIILPFVYVFVCELYKIYIFGPMRAFI